MTMPTFRDSQNRVVGFNLDVGPVTKIHFDKTLTGSSAEELIEFIMKNVRGAKESTR